MRLTGHVRRGLIPHSSATAPTPDRTGYRRLPAVRRVRARHVGIPAQLQHSVPPLFELFDQLGQFREVYPFLTFSGFLHYRRTQVDSWWRRPYHATAHDAGRGHSRNYPVRTLFDPAPVTI